MSIVLLLLMFLKQFLNICISMLKLLKENNIVVLFISESVLDTIQPQSVENGDILILILALSLLFPMFIEQNVLNMLFILDFMGYPQIVFYKRIWTTNGFFTLRLSKKKVSKLVRFSWNTVDQFFYKLKINMSLIYRFVLKI